MRIKLRKDRHAGPKQPLKAEVWEGVRVPRTTVLQRRLVLVHIENESTEALPQLIER